MVNKFCDDLLGVPLNREINFKIDLLPDSHPILNPTKPRAPNDFMELKEKLKDLLYKGFIRPSIYSWDTLVLFMKKRWVSQKMHSLSTFEQSHNQ